MGDICRTQGQYDGAAAAYRMAAAKFAQRGLLVQSLLAAKRLLGVQSSPSVAAEVEALPTLVGKTDPLVTPHLYRGHGPVEKLLAELLSDTQPTHGAVGAGTPLLSHLQGEQFLRFATQVPLRRYDAEQAMIEQGNTDRSLFIIARGRALVFVTDQTDDRIYLATVTAGDFVGEQGFFMGNPRSATIEALYPTEAFEIDRDLFDRVMGDPGFAQEILMQFWDERSAKLEEIKKH